MSYLQEAFNQVCQESKPAEGHYVVLAENRPYYGGPEEGGWWGSDHIIHAYEWYDTEEAARSAREAVMKLANELTEESRKAYGDQCLREMDWLESRGLEADYLPEPDGDSEFVVYYSDELPKSSSGCRHYE